MLSHGQRGPQAGSPPRAGARAKAPSCRAQGREPESSAHSKAHAESTNPKKSTNVLFHFIAKILTINLTREEVSVSPASYSVSLRRQMTPQTQKKKKKIP